MFKHRFFLLAVISILILVTLGFAQRGRRRYRGGDRDRYSRNGVPRWEMDKDFRHDVFTFARVRYDSAYRRGGGWRTDYPDSDLNFSLRLQQLTSMRVNPEPVIVELTDKALFDYPFLYMVEPGGLYFFEEEVIALRRYLYNGGFLMVDDFWGDDEYRNFESQMQRVFPKRTAMEVPLSHEIFQCVYPMKEKPQIPAINVARWGREHGITWEERYSDTSTPYYKAITDDDGRIMVFICHNTDLGDGWEREGENEWYFHEFSVKKAYPLGINIVTYAMTH